MAEIYGMPICRPDEIAEATARFENTIRRDFEAAAANDMAIFVEMVVTQVERPDA